MAYEKHTWECGETITAEKLNSLEGGVWEALDCCSQGGTLIFTATAESVPCPLNPSTTGTKLTYSHFWQEIHDALAAGKRVVAIKDDGTEIRQDDVSVATTLGGYRITDGSTDDPTVFAIFEDATSKEYIDGCLG